VGRTGRISALACCATTILLTLGATTAPGHKTESKGVSVTMHVTPNDVLTVAALVAGLAAPALNLAGRGRRT
jgi:hypothetical protein